MEEIPSQIELTPFTAPENTMVFHTNGAERLRISSDGFWVNGQRIDDVHDVYNRFNDWLTEATAKKPTRRKKSKK